MAYETVTQLSADTQCEIKAFKFPLVLEWLCATFTLSNCIAVMEHHVTAMECHFALWDHIVLPSTLHK